MPLIIPNKDTLAYDAILLALERSGQSVKFPTREAYLKKRDEIADTLYLIYEVTFLDVFRTNTNYDYLTYVAQRFYLLLVYIFSNYFQNLPLWRLHIWQN
jgi:hypothetical protein